MRFYHTNTPIHEYTNTLIPIKKKGGAQEPIHCNLCVQNWSIIPFIDLFGNRRNRNAASTTICNFGSINKLSISSIDNDPLTSRQEYMSLVEDMCGTVQYSLAEAINEYETVSEGSVN